VVRFKGKVGKKKLKPGSYRVTLTAKNGVGKSKKVKRRIKVSLC
jgi:hypothetical protein